jgi:hypothetical protein
VDEGQLDHAAEVDGRFLEPGDDASRFLQPSDEALDDATAAIRLLVERNRPLRASLVLLARDDRSDAEVEQVRIDPLRSVTFVAGKSDWPSLLPALLVEQSLVGSDEQGVQHGRVVDLPGAEMEVKRMALSVT